MTDKELIARIARSAGQKAGYKQLVRELNLGGGGQRRLLLEQLARLTVRGADAEGGCSRLPRQPEDRRQVGSALSGQRRTRALGPQFETASQPHATDR